MLRAIRVAVACAALTVSACVTTTRVQTPELMRPIEVTVRLPAAEAFHRTLAVFAAEGITIGQAEESGGVIASVPSLAEGLVVGALDAAIMRPYLIYRANVIAADDGTSLVQLSLWVEIHEQSSRGAVVHPATPPGADCPTDPVCGEAWSRLTRIAERLRGAAT